VRVVLDTNTVVSGFLWENPPRRLIDAASEGRITLCTSEVLIAELANVLRRRKFARRIAEKQLSITSLIERYRMLADIVEPAMLSGTVSRDPDDDLVLATALGASAEIIVSGDADLLNLKRFLHVPIISPAEALRHIQQQDNR